tara:strand:- start:18100 stop:18576 length:477 start_codon:yes stop_codon:yes gene_type:complete
MKKKYKTHPYEFLFLINGNPIVGRNFPINNFNRESLKSYELKETIDDAVGLIQKHFKNKTYNYMDRYYNYFVASTEEQTEPIDIYENEDFFTLQIKVRGRVVCERIFSGNDYPPNVRYDVDIRKIIPKIIDYLQQGLSQKNYTKNLCGYQLDGIFINN